MAEGGKPPQSAILKFSVNKNEARDHNSALMQAENPDKTNGKDEVVPHEQTLLQSNKTEVEEEEHHSCSHGKIHPKHDKGTKCSTMKQETNFGETKQ